VGYSNVGRLIPAGAAAASSFNRSCIRFCISNPTCSSVIIRPSSGSDDRTRRQGSGEGAKQLSQHGKK
jgi:hypothetical protein